MAEASLRKSEKRYRELYEDAAIGIFHSSFEGRFLDVNPALAKMLGYDSPQDVLDSIYSIAEQIYVEPQARDEVIARSLSRGETVKVENLYRRKDGSEWNAFLYLRYVSDSKGQPICLQGFVEDITDRKQAEAALKESKIFLENMTDIAYLADDEGNVLWVNRAAESMTGLPPEDIIGKPFLPLFIDADHASLMDVYKRTLAGASLENTLTFKSGVTCHFTSLPKRNSQGDITGTFGVARDISDRLAAERFLQTSEARLKKAQAMAKVGNWEYDISTGKVWGSEEAFRIYGIERTTEFLPLDEVENHIVDAKRVNQALVDLIAQKKTYDIEFKISPKTGGGLTHIHSMADLVCDEDGKPVKVVGVIQDITERKTAELALRESEEKFRNFTEQSFVGFYINQDGLFKYVNPKFANIFGYTVEECTNNIHFRRLVHPEDLSTVQEQVGRRLTGQIEAVQYTFRGVKKTGEIIHVSVYGSSLIYQGRPAAIGTMLDITKELEFEKRVAQSQRMEAIGSLAGGIAHDFNNILFPIVGLSEILIDDLSPDSPEHENAVEIHKAGMRGRELVKQILAFSRQSEQKKMPIRIQQILKEVIKLSRSTIPANIEIKQSIQRDSGMVQADPTQIHQIAMNLITNAYHAVEPKNGAIEVRLREIDIGFGQLPESDLLPGKYALLSVSDTGVGMDPAVMQKVFEPYFTTKEQGKGTGLGLAVVYGIVKAHNGGIQVTSELGKGTTFNVYLPIMAQAEKSAPNQRPEELATGHERILLVDDEYSIVKLEKQILERLGYKVRTHLNSLEALAVFKARPNAFDMVISDMSMPNMTGDRLARELIAIRPDIPIIICTGFSERLNREMAASIGVKGFLMKPVVKAEMAKVVRKVLDEATSSDQQLSEKESGKNRER